MKEPSGIHDTGHVDSAPEIGSVLGLLLLIGTFFHWKDLYAKEDPQRMALERIRASGVDDPSIYTGDANFQVLYFLLDATPPVRHIHPSLLWESKHRENLGMDHLREVGSVKSQPPHFLFFQQKGRTGGAMADLLPTTYQATDTLQEVIMYRRRS